MLIVIMLSVIMLSVIMLRVFMLRVIFLSVITLNDIMLSVIMLSVIMLSVIILSVVMLRVLASPNPLQALSKWIVNDPNWNTDLPYKEERGILNGEKYHSTIDLQFDWFGISCMTTDNFCFYLQNRLIQTSQTGGQRYSDTSPLVFPEKRVKDFLALGHAHIKMIINSKNKIRNLISKFN